MGCGPRRPDVLKELSSDAFIPVEATEAPKCLLTCVSCPPPGKVTHHLSRMTKMHHLIFPCLRSAFISPEQRHSPLPLSLQCLLFSDSVSVCPSRRPWTSFSEPAEKREQKRNEAQCKGSAGQSLICPFGEAQQDPWACSDDGRGAVSWAEPYLTGHLTVNCSPDNGSARARTIISLGKSMELKQDSAQCLRVSAR